MTDAVNVQVILRHGGENAGEQPAKIATEVKEETGRREARNGWVKRLRSRWQAVLIGSLMVLFYTVTIVLIVQIYKQQRLTAEFQFMAKNNEQLQMKNNQLMQLLNSPCRNITLLEHEYGQLKLKLNATQETSMQLEEENQHQRSILSSDKLSFLWRFCNKDTLQCSRCLSGWVEHASRCYFLSNETAMWETARSKCLEMGADLAVVLNAEDQAFLTNMTFDFTQQHPGGDFLSAWIGLWDVVQEGTYVWVNGDRLQKDVIYWKPKEPNNAKPDWDKLQEGQDCVAIVPPDHAGQANWLNTWDDIVCVGKRNYLCETRAFG